MRRSQALIPRFSSAQGMARFLTRPQSYLHTLHSVLRGEGTSPTSSLLMDTVIIALKSSRAGEIPRELPKRSTKLSPLQAARREHAYL